MMVAARQQAYDTDRRGRRYAVHTPGLAGSCRCKRCWARGWWTPERRAARAAEIRRQYGDGRRAWNPASNLARANHWTPERDAVLHELAGHVDTPTLIDRLFARFGYRYTESAVKHRIQRLGILRLERRPYTTGEVARMLGLSRETMLSTWIRPGILAGARRRGGPYGMYTFTRAELETFVSTAASRLDPSRIRDAGLRLLVQARRRGQQQLLGTREVRLATGVSHHVQADLYGRGLVPSARRGRGPSRYGVWQIEAADVELVRRLAQDRRAANDRRRLSRARDDAGRFAGRAR
jgi:hypothetical protein